MFGSLVILLKKLLETTNIPSFSVKSAVKLKTIQRKLMLVRRVEL